MIQDKFIKIEFKPLGCRGRVPAGQTLLETARQLGADLISLCGGNGKCGHCKVQILRGEVSPPTASELNSLDEREIHQGFRLACHTYPKSDLIVDVPTESLSTPQRVQVEGQEVSVSLEPPLKAYELELSPPSLTDLRADDERLVEGLKGRHQVDCGRMDDEVLRNLSPELRLNDWKVKATLRGSELIALGHSRSRQLGLALDLGTTKIAGYLLDLETGRTLASKGIMNPQIDYGEDVITRIGYALGSPDKARLMQEVVSNSLNQLAADLSAEQDAGPDEIVETVVVGNTAMHHLLLRLPVKQLARAPYIPAVRHAMDIKARDVGLHISAGAYMHSLPNIAGFVGSDHVSMLLSTECWKADGLILALDIGTNTEICMVCDGELTSVSCASGPAFEGAHIKWGMRASAGAIEHIRLENQRVEYQTIGREAPVGICGSGILDAMAQLYLIGVVDNSGLMREDHPRVRSHQEKQEFVLVDEEERGGGPSITITQGDVRELQLAKAAIRTGIRILLQDHGRSEDDIDQIIVAGAFGSYLDLSSAVTIGMLPSIPLDRFRQVGNAAGAGARAALISQSKRKEAQNFSRQIRYIELAGFPGFSDTFMQAISFSNDE